jgi:MFS transporter, putative metabolite transport protein
VKGHGTRRFLRRLTVATGGGMFIDGFVFATFAAAFAGRARDALHVTPLWESWISASVLIGTFFGGLFLGYVTDRIGRKPMFSIDLSVFLCCAVLMLLVTSPWQVFTLGVVMGLAVGADYSIGSPLLGEFVGARTRGNYLGLLEIMWNVGYVVAYLIGYLINTYEPGWWRIILAASAVPALGALIIRHGLPESPRWLLSKGRRAEAMAILNEDLPGTDPADVLAEQATSTRWSVLFTHGYIRQTVFACVFWSAIVLPYFALTFFQPDILRSIGLGSNALLGALLGTIIALTGATLGWWLVDRTGRRKILIPPMTACAVFLLLAAAYRQLPAGFGAVCFFGYLFSYGIMSILPGIYPEEVFPSSVRASGVGVATAASRAAAAFGTFLLPTIQTAFGTGAVLIIMGCVSLVGAVASFVLAPETNGRPLSHTSAARQPVAAPASAQAGARSLEVQAHVVDVPGTVYAVQHPQHADLPGLDPGAVLDDQVEQRRAVDLDVARADRRVRSGDVTGGHQDGGGGPDPDAGEALVQPGEQRGALGGHALGDL